MKKEVHQYIFTMAETFFSSFGLKSKKGNSGGVTFQKNYKNVKIDGGFGFRFNEYNQIEYLRGPYMGVQFLEVESIYNILLTKHSINLGSPLTLFFDDQEWRNSHRVSTLDLSDLGVIDIHTNAILSRFEGCMFPLAEQYLSLSYWAKRYEEGKDRIFDRSQLDSYYRLINDNYNLKHLIILKLCGSPSFEEAFQDSIKPSLDYLANTKDTESKDFKIVSNYKKILSDLKEILDNTQPLYDWQDLTPPFRFTKSDVPVTKEKRVWQPKAVRNGEKVGLEVNGLDITSEQKQKVEAFLKSLNKHFETTVSELIENAKFENEGSNYEYYEDCQFFIYSVAEFAGLLNDNVTREYEDTAAPFVKLNHMSIDVEEGQVLFVLGHGGEETINAHLNLDGHVEIITGK